MVDRNSGGDRPPQIDSESFCRTSGTLLRAMHIGHALDPSQEASNPCGRHIGGRDPARFDLLPGIQVVGKGGAGSSVSGRRRPDHPMACPVEALPAGQAEAFEDREQKPSQSVCRSANTNLVGVDMGTSQIVDLGYVPARATGV